LNAADLMTLIRGMGGRFEMRDGSFVVVPPREEFWAHQIRMLRPRLVELRADVLAILEGTAREEVREHAGRVCPECRALLFYDDPAEAERMCRLRAKRWGDGRSGYCPSKPAVGRS
jgi:hypothetical protein